MWRNCRRHESCKVVAVEAGTDRVEVRCGKDDVTLETRSGRTILRGAFGEREISPRPLRIIPTRTERRDALVDC